jgi:hypothetical protein
MKPFSFGASISSTLIAFVHSQRASIVGVLSGQSVIRVLGSTSIAVAFAHAPERHINFLFKWRSKCASRILETGRTVSFLLGSAAKRTLSGSTVNV